MFSIYKYISIGYLKRLILDTSGINLIKNTTFRRYNNDLLSYYLYYYASSRLSLCICFMNCDVPLLRSLPIFTKQSCFENETISMLIIFINLVH